jgi:hypothetical protein
MRQILVKGGSELDDEYVLEDLDGTNFISAR